MPQQFSRLPCPSINEPLRVADVIAATNRPIARQRAADTRHETGRGHHLIDEISPIDRMMEPRTLHHMPSTWLASRTKRNRNRKHPHQCRSSSILTREQLEGEIVEHDRGCPGPPNLNRLILVNMSQAYRTSITRICYDMIVVSPVTCVIQWQI